MWQGLSIRPAILLPIMTTRHFSAAVLSDNIAFQRQAHGYIYLRTKKVEITLYMSGSFRELEGRH